MIQEKTLKFKLAAAPSKPHPCVPLMDLKYVRNDVSYYLVYKYAHAACQTVSSNSDDIRQDLKARPSPLQLYHRSKSGSEAADLQDSFVLYQLKVGCGCVL